MIARMRVLVLVAALSGCGGKPHVTLQAPPANLTPEQRVHAFQTLRRGAEGAEIRTTCGRGGCSSSTTELLFLRNGTEIRYAEDVLPVLPADSPAATAARDVGSTRQRSKRWARAGWLMFVGGFVVSMVSFANEKYPFMYAGLATTVGGIGVIGYSGFVFDREVNRKTRFVFDHYDQGLAARFDVCVNGIAVVPCEVSGGLPPPAVEPDPALHELRQK